MARSERHLPAEVLHAYAAGEVDPARRAVYATHLEGCAACRGRLDNVHAVQALMREASTPDLDELSWRRLQARVRTRLQDEAREAPPTQDLRFMQGRWATAGLVAVAAVALLVWFAPRRDVAPAPSVDVDAEVVRHVLAREAPVDLTLRSGVELELGARGRLEVRPGPGSASILVLSTGTLEVRDLRPPTIRRPIRVEAAPYTVVATHSDFTVRRLAEGAEVDVTRGAAQVAQGRAAPARVVAGERRLFGAVAAVAERPEAKRPAARPAAEARPKVEPEVELAVPEAPPPGAGWRDTPAASAASGSRTETEVRVEVEPPSDPGRRALMDARRAYYADGDIERAIARARVARTGASDAADRRAATELLCNAYTAGRRSEAAVEACGALVEGAAGASERRTLHKQLADIHRAQRGDCARAIEHYNEVLVFGQSTPLDDEARLFRAECALQTGDTMLAERDLAQLDASPTFRRRDALVRLREQLSAKTSAQDRSGVTDKR